MIEVRLEEILKERGQSFYWLAKAAGVGHTSIFRLRHGQAKGIPFDLLEKVCRALDCQPGDLLVMTEEQQRSKPKRKRRNTRR
jgi:putative transcriptional regulator